MITASLVLVALTEKMELDNVKPGLLDSMSIEPSSLWSLDGSIMKLATNVDTS